MLSEAEEKNERGLWGRLKAGLSRSRGALAEGVGNLLLGEKEIDESVLEELETALLLTDVGVDATQEIMTALGQRVRRRELNNTAALHEALGGLLKDMLVPLSTPFEVGDARPFVVFFVGVNGVGKTTTIGKLARRLQGEGKSVLLAAGDTFRAAAIDQLKIWAERTGSAVVARDPGADAAGLVFDDLRMHGTDVLAG